MLNTNKQLIKRTTMSLETPGEQVLETLKIPLIFLLIDQ